MFLGLTISGSPQSLLEKQNLRFNRSLGDFFENESLIKAGVNKNRTCPVTLLEIIWTIYILNIFI